jgi:methylmalonyl-CoA mutase C-terminal domain/subunit
MQVAYPGPHQTPEKIAETAVRGNADIVGISVLSGAHMTLVPRILAALKSLGIRGIYDPGAST